MLCLPLASQGQAVAFHRYFYVFGIDARQVRSHPERVVPHCALNLRHVACARGLPAVPDLFPFAEEAREELVHFPLHLAEGPKGGLPWSKFTSYHHYIPPSVRLLTLLR